MNIENILEQVDLDNDSIVETAGHEDEPWLNAPFYGENPYYDYEA